MKTGRTLYKAFCKFVRGEYAFVCTDVCVCVCVRVCVCCCCLFVFTCVSKLHIFYHLDNYECNMYANTLERWSKHALKDPPPKDLNDQEPFEQRFSVDEGNKVRE